MTPTTPIERRDDCWDCEARDIERRAFINDVFTNRLHYDYDAQCWVRNGYVAECGHLTRSPACYACDHAGDRHACHAGCAS